uniref:Methyltransferase str2 n=1 Tax=Strobilurus tenacellus TaxID=41251 RepID=STR2_STRTC|nr:RecName: Full=Methyltransferase str2; AltName: Full=Strobilurin A biosynthesis cluster protein r2 [Strobilurus tenacellus]ATV82112.1 S-adomet dependent methyltransferase 1 [Strobilurus tenacellus]
MAAESAKQTPYVLVADEVEWARLDAMHNGIAKFLGNELTPVDLGQPKKILEIGAGSGAWAIQAAKLYPDADVLAIDMNPIPARPLPPNVRYQNINVLEPFPFEAASFDVIHIRLVLCHLPDGHSVLKRIIDLVAPGGWLLIDDIDWAEAFEGLDKAPGIKRGLTALVRSMEAEAGDPHYGKTLKPYLEASKELSEVHVREVELPVNPIPEDPALAGLSQMMRKALVGALGAAKQSSATVGLTKEVQEGFLSEMAREDMDWSYSCYLYFAAVKKSA